MPRTTQYLQSFEVFTLSNLDKLTAKERTGVTLKRQARQHPLPGRGLYYYPKATATANLNLYARTRTFSPSALTEWGVVQLLGGEPIDEDGDQVGFLDLRLYDGTDQRYWNGSTWAVVADVDNDWNTLAEFNTNLSSYTGASLAVEIRLRTTDEKYTPELLCVVLRWTGVVVNVLREWIFETVVASLKAGLRPLTDLTMVAPGGSTITLTATTFDNQPNITDVVAVYDHTNDPTHATDLLSSYVGGVITLTTPIDAGNIVYLTAEYQPDVAVTTSSDYPLEAKSPAVWITNIVQVGQSKLLGVAGPSIVDESVTPPTGTVYPQPIPLIDLDFTALVVAPRALDLTQLTSTLDGWFVAHPTVRSPAFDERVSLERGPVLDWATATADVDDTRPATVSWRLLQIPVYGDPAASNADADATGEPVGPVDAYGVGDLHLTFRVVPDGGEDTFTIPE